MFFNWVLIDEDVIMFKLLSSKKIKDTDNGREEYDNQYKPVYVDVYKRKKLNGIYRYKYVERSKTYLQEEE